jgi:hypothetical protein
VSTAPPATRLVALGASNLTRGLQAVVSTARRTWGPEVEILGALGHGRSYGVESRVAFRTLPGILECGLWRELQSGSPTELRAVITDVGNDIPHGWPAERIVSWVEECVERLRAANATEIVLTDLPMAGLRRLSTAGYVFFRSLFFPGSRLPLAEAAAVAEAVSTGLSSLARRHSLRLVLPRPEWYGRDPIHIRRGVQRVAWRAILCDTPPLEPLGSEHARDRLWEAVQLHRMRAERVSVLGVERLTVQRGRRLRHGGRVSLY